MPKPKTTISNHYEEAAAIHTILEGTATETGEKFFAALVKNLAIVLDIHTALITEYDSTKKELHTLASWINGEWQYDSIYHIAGTPCAPVIENADLVHFPDNLQSMFPDNSIIKKSNLTSYMGVPLKDVNGVVLGHLAVMDDEPMQEEPTGLALFQIFAARAAAELQRIHAEQLIFEREAKLARLINSTMDAIVELDNDLNISLVNPAAEKMLGKTSDDLINKNFSDFIFDVSQIKLTQLIDELDKKPEGERYGWIPGGLKIVCSNDGMFQTEATLAKSELDKHPFYTLILRNLNDKIQSEKKIQSLIEETQYLKQEILELHHFDEIIGKSTAIQRVLHDVKQVAETNSTVIILGETGTGKELIARAVHNSSRRKDKPLIKVNCAAIPATLIESEFFGHEQGAFTGATKKRDGRFALADGGSIFLDEVGELPIDLQSKLLRVLQEGEFEPVGSSKTKKVNVRILAATNRDLYESVQQGEFREDLYYRLNVFPIEIPPLRDRDNDIVLLATAFMNRFAKEMGRKIEPLTEHCVQRLKSYDWPGNVRELENVIERSVITAKYGRLNLGRSIPMVANRPATRVSNNLESSNKIDRVLTGKELEELEKKNLLLALSTTNWRVSGDSGAANLLGVNPSTLNSRIKTLGIDRP